MATCSVCGVQIPLGQEAMVRGKDRKASLVTLCPACVAGVEKVLEAETQHPNLLGGVLLGLGAAIVASGAWYAMVVATKYQLGIVAVLVGWLVAMAVVRGAGNKRGPVLQATSAAITVLAMAASEYLIVRHFGVQHLAAEGRTGIPLLLTLIVEGLKADWTSLFFWAIAIWQAVQVPAKRKLPRVAGPEAARVTTVS